MAHQTIRRNASKKIAKLVEGAIRATVFDHGDMGRNEDLEVGSERAEALLADWMDWAASRGKGRTSCYASLATDTVRVRDGETFRADVLTLAWHSNRGIDFYLAERPNPTVSSPCGISPQAVEPKSLQAELVEWLAA